jgi:proteic killer suppression protein
MRIGRIRHKGLRRFYERDDASGLPATFVEKIRDIFSAIEFAERLAEIETVPGWRLHALKGARAGSHALVVSRNWRLTFRLDGDTVTDVDFEDYH